MGTRANLLRVAALLRRGRRASSPVRGGRTNRLAKAAAVLFAVYSLLVTRNVVAQARDGDASEIFPFFMWSLFSTVPVADQTSYGIRLTEMNGAHVDRVYFEETVLPAHQSSQAQVLIGHMGWAWESGRLGDVEHDRRILESRYLYPLETASYELVRREYDVEERYGCGCFTSEVVLTWFTMEDDR